MPSEVWKPISEFEGLYEVSNMGAVRSLDRTINSSYHSQRKIKGRILCPKTNKGGYRFVCLCKFGKLKYITIHRIVAEAFLPNTEGYPIINHIDSNRKNNRFDNLEWCTQQENLMHSRKYGNYVETRNMPVIQMDKAGNTMRIFVSANEAGRKTKIHQGNISACCNGRIKSSGGYVWRYVHAG